jgi:acyl transferase domain-containing protein
MGVEYTGDEIAVVGLAGRFPGADGVPALWRNLCDGVDAVHDYTDAELRALGIGEALLADPSHVRAGGRLDGVEDFDAELFGFDEDLAARTDPQQRLFLEQSWAALEDAGYDPDRYQGTVGVFASASLNRYFLFHLFGNPAVSSAGPDDWEGRLVPGAAPDYLPAQVAYRLGLTGPAVAVQTACSSSLVAVCLAAQSLLDFRCDLALAGGTSVAWPRHRHTPGGLVSPDGRCRAFDAGASGAGYSSGVAVVVLKRLADALADRDRIEAVLRGWAVNNDGAVRAGFAAPGVDGQAAVVAEALAGAEVPPDGIGLVEAHASGTPAGDAIEVAALTRAYRLSTDRCGYCALGSAKTNLGNLDAAAGVTGLVKTILAVRHGTIPANLHYQHPNPEIDLPATPFFVPVKTLDWPDEPRRAGVSSFGLGGTNAHVVVEQAPDGFRPGPGADPGNGGWRVLPLSARTPEQLRHAAARLRAWLAAPAAPALADVAYTLAVGRRAFPYRVAVACRDLAGAVAALDPDRLAALAAVPAASGAAPAPDPAGGRALLGGEEDARELGRRWALGAEVDWEGLYAGGTERRVALPTYPFQRRRCWIDPPGPPEARR